MFGHRDRPVPRHSRQLLAQLTVGTALLVVQAPMNPNEVDAPAPSAPFQDSFFTVTLAPVWVLAPPHRLEMV